MEFPNQPSTSFAADEKCISAIAKQEIKKPAEAPKCEPSTSLVVEEKRMVTRARNEVKKAAEVPKRKPTTSNLVLGTIKHLKDVRGSSFADIKKYLVNKYESSEIVDEKKLKLFVKSAVQEGILEKDGVRYRIKEATKVSTNKNSTKKSPTKPQRKTGSKEKTSGEPKTKKGLKQKKSSEPEKSKKSKIVRAEVKPEANSRLKKSEAESVEEVLID